MKEKSQKLLLAIDFGGSMTKVIGGTSASKRVILAMEPQVIEVPSTSVTLQETQTLGQADPKDRAWIGINEQYYAVGYLAQYRFLANPRLSQLKSETALYKVLASVWILTQALKLTNPIQLGLCCVLPPGEYKDKQRFETQVREALKQFTTPTGEMTVELVDFECKPESGGIYLVHRAKKGETAVKNTVTAVFMLGYRNASLILCHRGNVGEFQTSDLGFVQLVKGVLRRSSGQSLERLAPAIAESGEELAEAPLKRILRSSNPTQQTEELAMLKQAISNARAEYSVAVGNWLKEILPPEVEEVVLSGGTADYLKTELRQHLQNLRLFWHANVEFPDDITQLGMENRFGDVWSMWLYYTKTFFQKQQNMASSSRITVGANK